MADYPAVPQHIGTTMESSRGTAVDRAVSGKPRLRSYYSKQWDVFKVVHDWIDSTSMGLLTTHYGTDRLLSFSFTYAVDGLEYTVMYADAPQVQVLEGDEYFRVTNTLVTV